jgi:hypothetical protein
MLDDSENRTGQIRNQAGQDFEQAFFKGFWRSILGWLRQTDNQLLPFDEVRKILPSQGQYDVGIHQIPLDKVIGSVGRYNDFDRAFLPTQRHTRSRWVNVDIANLKDIVLPPIEVYKVGDVYFVKDGNHRVSVAREKGQKFIDANVIEILTEIEIDTNTRIDEMIRRQEKAYFYRQTGILDVRPDANIELTLPGGYDKLLEHISVHRWYMGERAKGEISYPEAVAGWYDEVYYPLVKVIKEGGILSEFPGRTPTDLYLWIIEHLWYLRQEINSEVSMQEAAHHFTDEFSKNPLRKLWQLIRKVGRVMASGLEDASDRELGVMPEDMLIDDQIQDLDHRSQKTDTNPPTDQSKPVD